MNVIDDKKPSFTLVCRRCGATFSPDSYAGDKDKNRMCIGMRLIMCPACVDGGDLLPSERARASQLRNAALRRHKLETEPRQCVICMQTKPASDFYVDKLGRHWSACLVCKSDFGIESVAQIHTASANRWSASREEFAQLVKIINLAAFNENWSEDKSREAVHIAKMMQSPCVTPKLEAVLRELEKVMPAQKKGEPADAEACSQRSPADSVIPGSSN